MKYQAIMASIVFSKKKGFFDAAVHAHMLREKGWHEAFVDAFFDAKKSACFSCAEAEKCPFLAVVLALDVPRAKADEQKARTATTATEEKIKAAQGAKATKTWEERLTVALQQALALSVFDGRSSFLCKMPKEESPQEKPFALKEGTFCLQCEEKYESSFVFCPQCGRTLHKYLEAEPQSGAAEAKEA